MLKEKLSFCIINMFIKHTMKELIGLTQIALSPEIEYKLILIV